MPSWLEENFPDLYTADEEPTTNRTDVLNMKEEVKRYLPNELTEEDRHLNSLWFHSAACHSAIRPRPEAIVVHLMEHFAKFYDSAQYEEENDCRVRYGNFPGFSFNVKDLSKTFFRAWGKPFFDRVSTIAASSRGLPMGCILYVPDNSHRFFCLWENGFYFLIDEAFDYTTRKQSSSINRLHFLKYNIIARQNTTCTHKILNEK